MKQITRIILFGDSWVEGQGVFARTETDSNGKVKFFENVMGPAELRKWRYENGWNKFLKKYVDCEIVNYAVQGSSNYAQFSQLNRIIKDLKDTDLILFGFTSKYRDTSNQIQYAYQLGDDIINSRNPLRNIIAYDKAELNTDRNFIGPFTDYVFHTEFEEKFTKNHISDFFVKVFDEAVYENIAQENYLFYQNWFKQMGLNIIFFDLFEQYVNPKYINKWYAVDTTMYITYGNDTMHQTLLKYEKEVYTPKSAYSIWEYAEVKFPPNDVIYHPNQFGYEYYVDYLWNGYISKQYKF